jgi:hypothetical protein
MKNLKLYNMKNWKLIMLEVELIIRWIALIFGYLFSFFALIQIFWIYTADNVYDKIKINTLDIDSGIIIFIVKSILPLLISIFILVSTRKFKEINQLIEENKKL